MRSFAAALASILAFEVSPVLAQEPAPEPEYHALSTLDRVGTRSGYGIGLSYRTLDHEYDDSLLRCDLHGRLVTARGIGLALSLPFTRVSGEYDDDWSAGNLGLFGSGIIRWRELQIVLQGGVFLPMARNDFESIRYAIRGGMGRLTDLATAYPDTATLRVGASPELALGSGLFVRGDVGLDLLIIDDDETEIEPLGRFNLAVGYDLDPVTMAMELATLLFLDELGGYRSQATHTIAVSARLRDDRLGPHVSLAVPLDDDLDSDVGVVFMAGIEFFGTR